MKTPMRIILAALLLVLLCLPASAEVETKQWSKETIVAVGETRLPYYPDYSSRCGEGVTIDDVNVSYKAVSGKDIKVAKDGTITVPENLAPGTYYVEVTYAPKKSGIGRKTTATLPVTVINPLLRMTTEKDEIVMAVGTNKDIKLSLVGSKAYGVVSTGTYDTDIISAGASYNIGRTQCVVTIKALEVGETELVMTSYNGIVKKVRVVVVGPVTKAEYASDHFTCYVGDTVDLGLDLGNGPEGHKAYWDYRRELLRNGGQYHDKYGQLYYRFTGYETGDFTMKLNIEGFEASTQISVYDRANCADIQIAYGDLTIGSAKQVKLYDASGRAIYRPMSITAGKEHAKLQYDKVTGVAAGSFTITVQNEDGSTTSKTFTVGGEPNLSLRKTLEVTLDIGDTFDILPDFADANRCTYYFWNDGGTPADGLYCIRMEGNTIVAQAPGSGRIDVQLGGMEAWVKVKVRESDKVLRIVMPEEPIGIGQTFQLTVQDEAGNIYPATFDSSWGYVDVTPEGLLTGVKAGWYSVNATLADGRRIKSDMVEVLQIPARLMHPSITALLSEGSVPFETIESDVGSVPLANVKVEIEDESIATKQGNQLYLHKAGSTVVKLTAINGGATTSFTLEVIEDARLYIATTSMKVPVGYGAYLPTVLDGNKKPIAVTWEITLDNPGPGNPEPSGFILEDDAIICTWLHASCEVTGTAANGQKVKVTVQSYKIVEEIALSITNVKLDKGSDVTASIIWDSTAGELGNVQWIVEDETVVKLVPAINGPDTAKRIVAEAAGTTQVAVLLDNGVYAVCTVTVFDPYVRHPGDANEDGIVDIHDALLVMQHDAGWNVSINGYAADVNADGKVNGQDGLLLLQYSAGLDVELRQYVPEE